MGTRLNSAILSEKCKQQRGKLAIRAFRMLVCVAGLLPITKAFLLTFIATSIVCILPANADVQIKSFLIQIKNLSDYRMDGWTFGEGVWVLHDQENPLFKHGEVLYENGMKHLIEQGNGIKLLEGMVMHGGIITGAAFPRKTLAAGEKMAFVISATPGQRLSFAIRLHETNDKFFAPMGKGISLFDFFAQPISGTLTEYIHLWDGGSAFDQQPVSEKQATQYLPDPNGRVRLVTTGEYDDQDGFRYPRVETIFFVSIKSF